MKLINFLRMIQDKRMQAGKYNVMDERRDMNTNTGAFKVL